MPITPTSTKSKQYQALGIDEIANDIETAFEAINELEAGGGSSYTVYTALLTQSGTDAPVATVLENTLGGAIVWTYNSVGNYTGTLAGAFTVNKTIIFTNQNYASGGDITYAYPGTVNELYIETMDITGANANDILVPICIEIRVYTA